MPSRMTQLNCDLYASSKICHQQNTTCSLRICTFHFVCGCPRCAITHTHTHTRLKALFLGLPGWASTKKEKPIWILLKQETVSGTSISWAICKSAPRSRQITTPTPYHSVFYKPDALPAAQPTASKHWRRTLCNKWIIITVMVWQSTHKHSSVPTLGSMAVNDKNERKKWGQATAWGQCLMFLSATGARAPSTSYN